MMITTTTISWNTKAQRVERLSIGVPLMPGHRYVGLAAMLATKKSAGVAPEVNLRECVTWISLTSANKAAHSGFEMQMRHHQKSKTKVSVTLQKGLMSSKLFFFKRWSWGSSDAWSNMLVFYWRSCRVPVELWPGELLEIFLIFSCGAGGGEFCYEHVIYCPTALNEIICPIEINRFFLG